MKLQVIAAALAFVAFAPALAADGQIMRDPQANYRSTFKVGHTSHTWRCFNGKQLSGINRRGDKAVLVQTQTGPIYELAVPQGCPALDAARKVTVSASGGGTVCAGQDAELSAVTASGAKRCYVAAVRQLPADEVRLLAQAPVR